MSSLIDVCDQDVEFC